MTAPIRIADDLVAVHLGEGRVAVGMTSLCGSAALTFEPLDAPQTIATAIVVEGRVRRPAVLIELTNIASLEVVQKALNTARKQLQLRDARQALLNVLTERMYWQVDLALAGLP